MRLTLPKRRLALAMLTACVVAPGCQRLPYIDQAKTVPHDRAGTIREEDAEVKRDGLLKPTAFTSQLPMPLPKVAKPRTTNDPEAEELWPMSLEEAIRIGLDNSEVIRVISLGAQGIPVSGFEPTPLNNGAGAGVASSLGAGQLQTVYDPAIQETQIAQALSTFDAQLSTNLFYGKSFTPLNNGIAAGTISAGARYPILFQQDTGQLQSTLQKRTATGSVLQIQHNINFAYTNSPINVYPSAYTTNTQLQITQPLLGGTAQNPSGLEANRAPIVIARLNADAAVWRFKAEVMAHVRSIEQQYWALSQQHVQLWSREAAVTLGEEILRREQAELEVGRGTIANVAEARQQLEQFRLNLVTATSDVITTERQLRNILGLPPADNRRIIPVTPPNEARVEPDWESSLAQMISFQPDIVTQQLVVRLSELQLLLARNQLLPVLNLNALYQFNGLGQSLSKSEGVMTGSSLKAIDPRISALQRAAGLPAQPGNYNNFETWQVGLTFQMPLGFRGPLANTRSAQYSLLRQRAYLQQIVHQTTHSLARFFLEVDANYKQFRTARNVREAAAERLDAQRAFYEEGRILIDRYLDAVSQYANAVATEAQYKTSYNTSIVALEEAKGTLLAYNNIAVAEGPYPRRAYQQARDQQGAHRRLSVPGDGPYTPEPVVGPVIPDPVPTQAPPTEGVPSGTVPPLPAPVGPLGPLPTPMGPTIPVGEPNIRSEAAPAPADFPALPPAMAEAPAADPALVADPTAPAPPALAELPASAPEPGVMPASVETPAPAEPAAAPPEPAAVEPPIQDVPIDLPPLPATP
ncbi:TolC family protein [Isosphaeraceae bacterium EP7]